MGFLSGANRLRHSSPLVPFEEQKMSAKGPLFAGLDLGGTTVKEVIQDENGKPVGDPLQVPADIEQGMHRTFSNMENGLRDICRAAGVQYSDIRGAVFATPGPATVDGFIVASANLNHPDWRNVNVATRCEAALRIPTRYSNDANAAAAGEISQLNPTPDSAVYFAPGTGLGAGDLQRGRLNPGKFGFRCELGHIMIPREMAPFHPPKCGCGGPLCVERILSIGGLEFALNMSLEQDEWSGHDFLKPEFGEMTTRARACRLLRHTWATKDPLGMRLFSAQAEAVGYLYYDIVVHFDPDVVIIGGGWSDTDAPKWFHDMIIERAAAVFNEIPLIKKTPRPFELSFAKLGDYAGAYGAADMARRHALGS